VIHTGHALTYAQHFDADDVALGVEVEHDTRGQYRFSPRPELRTAMATSPQSPAPRMPSTAAPYRCSFEVPTPLT
jgi:hypothetical protein